MLLSSHGRSSGRRDGAGRLKPKDSPRASDGKRATAPSLQRRLPFSGQKKKREANPLTIISDGKPRSLSCARDGRMHERGATRHFPKQEEASLSAAPFDRGFPSKPATKQRHLCQTKIAIGQIGPAARGPPKRLGSPRSVRRGLSGRPARGTRLGARRTWVRVNLGLTETKEVERTNADKWNLPLGCEAKSTAPAPSGLHAKAPRSAKRRSAIAPSAPTKRKCPKAARRRAGRPSRRSCAAALVQLRASGDTDTRSRVGSGAPRPPPRGRR